MTFITDFADQAVILPLALAMAIGLLALGWHRGALAWSAAVIITLGFTLLLKLLFLACPMRFGQAALRTPSGHVAAATVVVAGLALLLLRRSWPALVVAIGAAVLIGVTRLTLGMHTPAEVLVGGGVGLAGGALLVVLAGPPPRELKVGRLVLLAAVIALLLNGLHLPAEAQIRITAWRFGQLLGLCQSTELRL